MNIGETIGVIGTGQLTEYIITGINKVNAPYKFIVSPRSKEVAIKLKDKFQVEIAKDNQEVINSCEKILICLPAKNSLTELKKLNFRKENILLSAMGGINREAICTATKINSVHTTMMPGYANAYNIGPSLLFPEQPSWHTFLSFLGPVFICENERVFEVAATIGAVSGASFSFIRTLTKWFEDNGVEPNFSQDLVIQTLKANLEMLSKDDKTIDEIIAGVTTPGGITEHLNKALNEANAMTAWNDGLDDLIKKNE